MLTIIPILAATLLNGCYSFHTIPDTAISLQRANEMLARLPKSDPSPLTKDASIYAWGESPVLHALADLYEASHDPAYLVMLAERGQRILSQRNDRRNAVDGSGKVRPGWTMGYKYVVASGELKGANGNTIIEIRSTPSSNNHVTTVEVIPASEGITIKVHNPFYKRNETFANISLDPANERFAGKVINDPMAPYSSSAGEYTSFSNLIRIKVLKNSPLPAQTVKLSPIPLAYTGYYGVIYHPMLRFAETVKKDPALKSLLPAADSFIVAAEQSYADVLQRLWREGPGKDEGYILTCEKGESFPADNVGQPFNFLGRHVCALLALHRLTGKVKYKDAAEKMCRLFRNRLKYNGTADLYEWNYWYEPMTTTGWKPEDGISANVKYFKPAAIIEDVSHGILDIAMVATAAKDGVVFDSIDMKRFANTLLLNVLMPDRSGVRRRVNGEGPEHPLYFDQLHGWLELTPGNAEVYKAIREAYLNKGEESLVFCARLLKWEQALR